MRITLLHRTRECLFWRFRAGWKDSDRNWLLFDQERFCCLKVLEEQSGSSLKVKRKENKTRWRLPDIVCPLDASAACIGLTSEAFGPKAVHTSETREMVGHRKRSRGKGKEGGRLVSGCKSSHMCLAAAAGRGSTGVRPKAAALIKFPWSLVNLRGERGWQGTAGTAKCLQRCCSATGKNTYHLCSYC